jgi:xanthine/uracil permease
MNRYAKYLGMALIVIGVILLIVCKLADWQSNAELLIGLICVVLGYILHLWLQKYGQKY